MENRCFVKQLSKMSNTICFIGGGNMAASLIAGLVADGYRPDEIVVSDPDRERLAQLAARYGVRTTSDNLAAVADAEILVLAVKPQILPEVASRLRTVLAERCPLVISIAAGVREAALHRWLGEQIPLVRSMPNTPAMIQSGATVLHAAEGVSAEQRNVAETILRAVGLTCWVAEEETLDIATALSGSGPAYFFYVMEVMERAACELGMECQTARLLTLQTALGAARMAMESSLPPGELRQQVTSPGGTTQQAITTLEEGQLPALFQAAMESARKRSIELSEQLGGR